MSEENEDDNEEVDGEDGEEEVDEENEDDYAESERTHDADGSKSVSSKAKVTALLAPLGSISEVTLHDDMDFLY